MTNQAYVTNSSVNSAVPQYTTPAQAKPKFDLEATIVTPFRFGITKRGVNYISCVIQTNNGAFGQEKVILTFFGANTNIAVNQLMPGDVVSLYSCTLNTKATQNQQSGQLENIHFVNARTFAILSRATQPVAPIQQTNSQNNIHSTSQHNSHGDDASTGNDFH